MLALLKRRSFGAMTASQFLGAFNDNAFKALVLFLAASLSNDNPLAWVERSMLAQTFGQALPHTLFALPFVLLGPLTGVLADRISKTRIVWWANAMEIGVMACACIAFSLQIYGVLMATVFLMGAQSALFGPAKYGIIRELVGDDELAKANSLIQASTMLAILSGTVVGGIFVQSFSGHLWQAGVAYVVFAFLGWAVSLRMQRTPPADPERVQTWNPVRTFFSHWSAVDGDRVLSMAIFSSAFFYMMAALFMQIVIAYGTWLGLPEASTATLHAMTGMGVIMGAWLAGRVSGKGVAGWLIPLGLFGLALSTLLMLLAPENVGLLRFSLFCMGTSSGLFTIPIRCLIHGRPTGAQRGSIQGLAEVMDFIGILLAGPLFFLAEKVLELTPDTMYMLAGLTVGFYAFLTWPLRSAEMSGERSGTVE
jgi:acyl-[acyl-carrier-protein]-phospholipid O-acyltransferase/long-chain-fatty-acid--[acyl-carrier-protein] ligase